MKKFKKVYLYASLAIFIIFLGVVSFIASSKKMLESNLTSGKSYLSQGNYSEAQLVFEKIIIEDKKNIDALLGSGEANLLLGNYDKAEELFEEAINVDKNKKDTYIGIQEIYVRNARLDDALKIVKLGYFNTSKVELREKLEEIKEKLEVPVIELDIRQGGTYALPSTVSIKVNSEQKELPITWSNDFIDINKNGEYVINGINEEYDRTAKVKLKVIPFIKTVEDVNITINQGEQFSLPASVRAKMSNESETEASVTWNDKVVDTSKPGNYLFEGKINEFDKSVKLNLQVKEVITVPSDKELLSLVLSAHNSLLKIIDDYDSTSNLQLFEFSNDYYIELRPEFNSYNKLYGHFNKYWSANASNKLIKSLDVKDRNGIYSRRFGEIGEGYFNTGKAKIVSKNVSDKKIIMILKSVDSAEEPMQSKAELVYSKGKWWVDYWQWAFELLGG